MTNVNASVLRELFYGNENLFKYYKEDFLNVVNDTMDQAFNGDTNQFIYFFDAYMEATDETKKLMVSKGREVLTAYAEGYGWKQWEKVKETITERYLYTFCALHSSLFVYIDLTKEGNPTSLVSRNVDILKCLHSMGLLDNFGTVMENFIGNKTAKSLLDESYVVYRLDVVEYDYDRPKFKVVTPRSNLRLGMGEGGTIIPLFVYELFELKFKEMFKDNAVEFLKKSINGFNEGWGTLSQDILFSAYSESPKEAVEARIAMNHPLSMGYDALKQRFVMYNLANNINSIGTSSFRPEMLEYVKYFDVRLIDKTFHNITNDDIRGLFKTRIGQAKSQHLDSLNLIDVSEMSTLKEKVEAYKNLADTLQAKDLYWVMKNNEGIFGNLAEGFAVRERMKPKYLKNFTVVDLPEDDDERVSLLHSLLSKGVVKIVALSTKGSLYERYASNNSIILEKALGKGYIKKYESAGYRLEEVKQLILSGKLSTIEDYEKVCVDYNISMELDLDLFFQGHRSGGDPIKTAVEAIEKAQWVVQERNAGRVKSNDTVVLRNINAENEREFYGSVKVGKILSIEFSENA